MSMRTCVISQYHMGSYFKKMKVFYSSIYITSQLQPLPVLPPLSHPTTPQSSPLPSPSKKRYIACEYQ